MIKRTVRNRDGTITVYGTTKYADLVQVESLNFNRCSIRKAEQMFIARYFLMLENPMRKHNPDRAQELYLAGEINWKCYITYAEGVRR